MNFIFKAAAASLMLMPALQAGAESYGINFPADATTGGRYDRTTSYVAFSSLSGGNLNVSLDQPSAKKLYEWHGSDYAAARPGDVITASVGAPNWMNAYLYIDLNNDGEFTPGLTDEGVPGEGSELLSFSHLKGLNSLGESVNGNTSKLPSFTLPENLRTGVYRIRFKVDWDSADPGGNTNEGNLITDNGGVIVDMPLLVLGNDVKPSLTFARSKGGSLSASAPGNVFESVQVSVKPDEGYRLAKMNVSVELDPSLADHGNPSSFKTVVPVMDLVGETVMLPSRFVTCATEISGEFEEGGKYNPYADAGYELVWHDEFNLPDGSAPDKTSWSVPARRSSAWNRFISTRPELAEIRDGNLVLKCMPNDNVTDTDPGEMVSGAICSQNKFYLTYGRIEARMMVEGYVGSFPAFWMMPNSARGSWPDCGEIDIFESINNQQTAFGTVHGPFNSGGSGIGGSTSSVISDYHVYGIEWSEGKIVWEIDGVPYFEVNNTQNRLTGKNWVYDYPFYIILNQSVGNGSWAANPDVNHTYVARVDWVRAYQKPGGQNSGVTVVEADATQQPEYFNLQGMKAGSDKSALAPGLYIERRGSHAGKIMIK